MTDQEEPGPITDNRMRFLRLLDSDKRREYSAEYEFASESRIVGQLNYSNDNLVLRLLTVEPNRDGLLKYILALAAPAEYQQPRYQASKDGYYFEGGGSEEVLSLVSLCLRCRLFPISYVFRNLGGLPVIKTEHDFSYIRPQKNADKYLFDASDRNFVTLDEFFEKVRGLPEALHHRFANAVRLYALALREVGVNDQQAYIHLVSAVEILSKYQTLPAAQDPLQSSIDQLNVVLEGGSPEARSELGNLLQQRKTMLKFIAFLQEYSDGMFLDRPTEGAVANKIYKDNLPSSLKAIYKARSKYLHEGSSMYLSMPGVTVPGCDYDASVGQTIDNREFDPEDKLPNLVFFEGLVRECLLKFLSKHSTYTP